MRLVDSGSLARFVLLAQSLENEFSEFTYPKKKRNRDKRLFRLCRTFSVRVAIFNLPTSLATRLLLRLALRDGIGQEKAPHTIIMRRRHFQRTLEVSWPFDTPEGAHTTEHRERRGRISPREAQGDGSDSSIYKEPRFIKNTQLIVEIAK